MNVQDGATVVVTRTLLSRNHAFGVVALGPRATARLVDVVVADTDAQACGMGTCAANPYGVGLAATSQASLDATRFEVHGSALCGVMVTDDGELDLMAGEVSGSLIGACLQVDDYAVSRLTDGVRYVDNGTNLDATSLPVPVPVNAVDDAR